MPRARTSTTEESITLAPKKRAPRKRAPVTDEEVTTPRPRTPRRRPVVEEAPIEVARTAEPAATRRAPTSLRAERTASNKSRRSLTVAVVLFCLLSGVGVAIGISDTGQIDVVAVVNERNERVNRGEVRTGESTISVPVQNGDIRPNGGLVPADPSAVPPPVETATSTDSTASSTDEGTDVATTTSELSPAEGTTDAPSEETAETST